MVSVLLLIFFYVIYTHAFKCSRYSIIFTRQRRVTIMTTSRVPLKPLREFLRHVAKFCLLPRDVRGKRFFQKLVLNYCNAVAHANRSQDPRRQAQSLRPGAVPPALLIAVPPAVPATNASGGRKANPWVV